MDIDKELKHLKDEYFKHDGAGFKDFARHYINGGHTALAKFNGKYTLATKNRHGTVTLKAITKADLADLKQGMLACGYFRHYSIADDIKTFFENNTMYSLMKDYHIHENTMWRIRHKMSGLGTLNLSTALKVDRYYRQHTDTENEYSKFAQGAIQRIKRLLKSSITSYQIQKATRIGQPSIDKLRNGQSKVSRIALKTAVKYDRFYCQHRALVKNARHYHVTPKRLREADRVVSNVTGYHDVTVIADAIGVNPSQVYRLAKGQSKLKNARAKTVCLLSQYYRDNRKK